MGTDTLVGGVRTATGEEPADLLRRARACRLRMDVEGYEAAVPLLREAIELDPTCAPAYAELARTYAEWGLRRESSCLGIRHETVELVEHGTIGQAVVERQPRRRVFVP